MGQYGTMFGGDMLPGSTGSTMGGGRLASANAVSAVDAGNGTLKAYDPTSMSMTTAPMPTYEGPSFNPAGMDARTGLPTYMTNWLAGGASGTAPTDSGDAIGTLFTPEAGKTLTEKYKANAAKPLDKNVHPVVDPGQGKGPGTTTPGNAPTLTQVPGSGLPQGGFQQPLFVNDQWQGGTGTSQPVATPALGSNFQPQFSAPIYTDGKGGYFTDPAGKVPLTGPALQQIKNSLGLYGHV